jgi:hypothetical protein
MKWGNRIKAVELGLGLGMAAAVIWILLSLILSIGFFSWLDEGQGGSRFLALLAEVVGLLLSLLVVGFISGSLLSTGRWMVSIMATLVAVAFRVAVLIIAAVPDPPWRAWPEAVIHLAALVGAVFIGAWGFRLGKIIIP